MEGRKYRIIISNKRIYKEIQLAADMTGLYIGTVKGCEIRFSKELFFEDVKIMLEKRQDSWYMGCSENLYITSDNILKLASREMSHGDEVLIKYQSSGQEVFKISFMIDFESEGKQYSRAIDIGSRGAVRIGGGMENDISIKDDLMGNDRMVLSRRGDKYVVQDVHTRYGVYVNGIRVQEEQEVGQYDFFSIIGYSFYIRDDKMYTAPSPNMLLNGLSFEDLSEQESQLQYPRFYRSTRMQYRLPEDEITIQQPESKPQPPKRNLVVALIPSLVMIVLIVVLRGIMGGSGGTFIIFSACSLGVGAAMSVVSFVSEKREYREQIEKRRRLYLQYIERKEEEIRALRTLELDTRRIIQESLEESMEEVRRFSKRLFEKSVKDPDFLHVYLGTGDVAASCQVKYQQPEFIDEDDDIADLPRQLAEKYRYIHDAPIIVDMMTSNSVGIVGRKEELDIMVRNMTLDLALRHFYKEVKLFYIFSKEDTERFSWVRWLRNVANEDLNTRNIVCDEESQNSMLEYLYNIASQRENMKSEENERFPVHFIIFVLDKEKIEKHPISRYFEDAILYGFTFVFLEEYEELLPRGCTRMIHIGQQGAAGTVTETSNGHIRADFLIPAVEDRTVTYAARRLAAVYVDEVSLESQLTRNITLFELLSIANVDDLDLGKRWKQSKVYKTMAAPLGVKSKNEIVSLDISDKGKAHGPHGLVAGTTGSGKSEILQTYVLSMASLYHPYDVGFVIIDFKGGGMANQFTDLPHLMGTITNIDGREINRSLMSIKAELVYRQEVFSRSGVNHINDYIKLYKSGKVEEPMPHLIMIVDEFAELKAEYPDFMKEIISAARIGRTLGVHLILATQKPSGVVDNQIWSNSKFRLCLKVQTKEDSKEVIKTPLAAEIVEPGRAYFQVGNNEIFELFQSAYSGAKVPTGEDNVKNYSIYAVNFWGKREMVFQNKKGGDSDKGETQLQAMVSYIHDYCQEEHIERLQSICLPPLAQQIMADQLEKEGGSFQKGVTVPLGYFDDPQQRRQGTYVLNISEGNTYVMGAAQTGKTTALQTILYQMIDGYGPSEVNIYIVDCGNMALKVFEEAVHVGGVALYTEEERVGNLFKMLASEVAGRKERFADKGIGTYRAYVEAGFDDLPQIVVMVDNITVFREYYAKLEDTLMMLSREGQSVGINLIVTGSQASSIGFRLLANYSNRITYHCNEKSEYNNLLERCRLEPQELPGRGLCVIDRRILEFQTALAFSGEKEIERVEHMRYFLQENGKKYRGVRVRPIPQVPEVIAFSSMKAQEPQLLERPYVMPVGLDYDSVQYQMMDLTTLGALAISGREKSGKTNFIKYIFAALKADIFNSMTDAYIIDSSRGQLEELDRLGFVREYTSGAEGMTYALDKVIQEMERRRELLVENRHMKQEDILKGLPLVMLVVNDGTAPAAIAKDKELQGRVNGLIKQAKNLKMAVIFSDLDNVQVTFQSPETLKVLKENKQTLVFDDMENIKICDVTAKQIKEFSRPVKPGDAYMFRGSKVSKLKTVLADG